MHFAEKIQNSANRFGRKYHTEIKLGKKVVDVLMPVASTAANAYGIYKAFS